MRKFTVSVFIVGAFVLYSFLYSHANGAALPTSSTVARSSTSTTTPSSGSSVVPTVPGPAIPIPTAPPAASTSGSGALYKDGTYTGSVADAQWGNLQVKVVIKNGKITDVPFLQYPNDRNRSIMINSYADPQLTSEAIQAQSANVDIVTGATDSSEAFIQSLTSALSQAKA